MCQICGNEVCRSDYRLCGSHDKSYICMDCLEGYAIDGIPYAEENWGYVDEPSMLNENEFKCLKLRTPRKEEFILNERDLRKLILHKLEDDKAKKLKQIYPDSIFLRDYDDEETSDKKSSYKTGNLHNKTTRTNRAATRMLNISMANHMKNSFKKR